MTFSPDFSPEHTSIVRSSTLPLYVEPTDLLVVPATVNGKRAMFVLDTGGSHTAVSTRFAKELGASAWRRSLFRSGDFRNRFMRLARINSFRLGEVELGGFEALVLNLDHVDAVTSIPIDGILAGNVLNRTSYAIEPRKARLRLMPSGSLTGGGIPLRIINGLLRIELHVGEKEIPFTVDTGSADQMVITEATLRRLGKHVMNIEESERTLVTIKSKRKVPLREVTLDEVKIDGIRIRRCRAVVGARNVLGMKFLKRYSLLVDPKERLLWLVDQ